MLNDLPRLDDKLADPDSRVASQQPEYAQNTARAIRPESLVLNLHCTHLGCIPNLLPEAEAQSFDAQWRGGLLCPCHRSKFDLAGRVSRAGPALATRAVVP